MPARRWTTTPRRRTRSSPSTSIRHSTAATATSGFAPMVELLRHLEANGFTNFIVSGGDRDFMRPVTHDIYGIPAERVVGSSAALRYEEDAHGGNLVYMTEMELFDDGPTKPVRVWTRIGRRPILAAGNSNGDVAMLRYTGGKGRPALRL